MIGEPKVLANLKIEVDRNRVARGLKGGSKGSPTSLLPMIDGELKGALALIEPKAVYVDLGVLSVEGGKAQLSGDLTIKSVSMAKLLSDCSYATIFVATIGGELEKEVERRFSSGAEAQGLILDTIGSEAAESLARRVQLITHDRAKGEGFATTGRFSPGYGDLSLSAQPEMVKTTEAHRIGVSLTEGLMLIPRKSVSAIVGWRRG